MTGVWRGRLVGYGAVAAVYVLATLLTDAHFMADTVDYVTQIVAYGSGGDQRILEFAHLLWRPFGWVVHKTVRPLAEWAVGPDLRVGVTWTLVALCWVAGLSSAFTMYGLLSRLLLRRRVVAVTLVAFVFAHGFLNFAQGGSPYLPGLALLLLSIYLLTDDRSETPPAWRAGVAGGVALGGSVCMWFLYFWAAPGALLAPLFLSHAPLRRRWRVTAWAALSSALTAGLAYAVVLWMLGIGSFTELREWVFSTSGGTTTSGATRMVFGLARSFINMGNDGMLFKRFLIGDPFNPVSMWELVRLSLWKFGLFYLFLLAVVVNLRRAGGEGRRMIAWWLIGSVPIIAFAVKFDGGAIERYLPLYPFLFLALARSLDHERAHPLLSTITLLFLAVATVTNASVMSRTAQGRQQEAMAARISDLQPRLRAESKVFTVNWQDDLVNFNRSYPFHPLNRDVGLRVNSLVTVGTTQVLRWREDLASQALAVWDAGGDVWVSRRALHERPRAEWNWAEGDDPRVSWTDFRPFVERLETGETLGGEDGFFMLVPSQANRQLFRRLVETERRNPNLTRSRDDDEDGSRNRLALPDAPPDHRRGRLGRLDRPAGEAGIPR